MTGEEYQREQWILAVTGTPWKVSPPFDLADFLAFCWLWVEYQRLQEVRYRSPALEW
jgi:hypothetical protein